MTKEETLRVAVVGANRARVNKVLSLVRAKPAVSEKPRDDIVVRFEFLACIATFGSYQDETGLHVRYLASVDFLGPEGKDQPSTLAPFFDEVTDDCETEKKFSRISGVAIGCGIEGEESVSQITSFISALSGGGDEENQTCLVTSIQPNDEFGSMKDENDAYKAMDKEEKQFQTELETIGPGKMAKFAYELAVRITEEAFPDVQPHTEVGTTESVFAEEEDAIDDPSADIDPTKIRYACRRCRTHLFGEADLEDPPHVRSLHSFSQRKGAGGRCESLFLAYGLPWMGQIHEAEGKFMCPKCEAKLGSWKWAGAQCSCGTWVTPAIQVPNSKVDVVDPYREGGSPLPRGTILHPSIVSPLNRR